MGSKRPNSDDPSTTRASLMNVRTGRKIPIKDDTEFIIGRAPTSTCIIEELFISGQHCVIKYENNRFFIRNLPSSSDTFLNCKHLSRDQSTELQQGDLIGFGDSNKITITFKFILHPITNKKPRLDNEHDAKHTEEKNKNIVSKVHLEMLSLNNTIRKLTEQVTEMMLQLDGNTNEEQQLKEQFYSNLESHFKCSICTELVCKATNLNCMHTFCENCICTWIKKKKVCPVCRAPILSYNRCLAVDNYIRKTCDLMGGLFQKQRQLLSDLL